jgi:benzoyl-CoA reductase/2-hydroxyglutaryl-CoA dehydratase subunit BcrC/BadD/HgdB
MNSKPVSIALLSVAVLSISFAFFQYSKSDSLVKENIEWKTKYEEALVDMEEANKRIETMKEDLEKALKESETHRKSAETALLELQQHKSKK